MKKVIQMAILEAMSVAEQQFEVSTQDSCMALALNGGGSKGSYQAGVIWGWMHYGNPDDFQWDVVTGISAGAINTGALSVWKKDDGLAMSEWLSDTWAGLHTRDIYVEWPGGLVWGLLEKSSIFDNRPLYQFLADRFAEFPDGVQRTSIVGTVDINGAEYLRFDGQKTDIQDWPTRIVSSASLPSLFIPAAIDDHICVDGGTAMGLDSTSAVEACLAKVGGDQTKVTVDVILLDRFNAPPEESDLGDTVSNIMREHSVKQYYHGLENVIQTQVRYPNVNYRYLVQPSGAYPKLWNLLNFSNSTTWPMQEEGRKDAQTSLDNPETHGSGPFSMLDLKDWTEDKNGIQQKWGGRFRDYINSFFQD